MLFIMASILLFYPYSTSSCFFSSNLFTYCSFSLFFVLSNILLWTNSLTSLLLSISLYIISLFSYNLSQLAWNWDKAISFCAIIAFSLLEHQTVSLPVFLPSYLRLCLVNLSSWVFFMNILMLFRLSLALASSVLNLSFSAGSELALMLNLQIYSLSLACLIKTSKFLDRIASLTSSSDLLESLPRMKALKSLSL